MGLDKSATNSVGASDAIERVKKTGELEGEEGAKKVFDKFVERTLLLLVEIEGLR